MVLLLEHATKCLQYSNLAAQYLQTFQVHLIIHTKEYSRADTRNNKNTKTTKLCFIFNLTINCIINLFCHFHSFQNIYHFSKCHS